MSRTSRLSLPVTALALLLAAASASPALASGFQLREQSASGEGMAFAGIAAGTSDISGMFFNPATLTAFDGFQLVLGGTAIAPKAELESVAGTRTALSGGSTISGTGNVANAANSAVLPEIYALWSVTKDFKLGLSVNVPFGLTTQYGDDFVGRYHALTSSLKTVDIGLNAAYRVNPTLSVGATLLSRHVDATLSNAVDYGELGFLGMEQAANTPGNPNAAAAAAAAAAFTPNGAASPYDGQATVNGSANVLGYKLGLVYQPLPTLRAGLSYQSATAVKIKGTVTYDAPVIGNAQLAEAMNEVIQGAGLVNGTAATTVNLPDTWSFGLAWDLSPTVTLAFEADQTGWSKFQTLDISFGSGQADNVTNENWHNTVFTSLGATWKTTEALTLRAGLAKDQGAVDTDYRTPRIPDANRTWLSLGLGYAFTKSFGVDAAYTYIQVQDSSMNLATSASQTDPNFLRGNLTGTFHSSIQTFAVQAHLRF